MLVGGCRVPTWCTPLSAHTPYSTLDRWRFGLRMIVVLLTLSASCIFPLQLHTSLPQTYDWLFSLMSANCLRPPAAMTNGWFLCKLSLQLVFVSFLGAPRSRFPSWSSLKKTALGMCTSSILVMCDSQPSAAAPEARWTLCWASLLARLTCSLAIWCQGWSASSTGYLLLINNPDLGTVQEDGNDDGSVYLDLCEESERVPLPYSLWQSSKRNCWLSISRCQDPCWLYVASLEITLPR